MERVTGIGGVFMRSRDPNALARWFSEHLGLDAFSEETDATWWQSVADGVVAVCGRYRLLRPPRADVDDQLPGP